MKKSLPLILLMATWISCSSSREQKDQLYSRHLRRKVDLTIIHTPIPSDKNALNLLILNDGQDLTALNMRHTLDSLYDKGAILPLVIVGVHAGDRADEYGVAGHADYAGHGSRAELYDSFIDDELYPYAKKQSGIRKFRSVAIAGWSLGGLSAFDIAWNHPEKIDKVGVFSGSFWWRDKSADDSTYSDSQNRIMYAKLKASRKKPDLKYWFSAGTAEENGDRDKDSIIDVIDDTRDIIDLLIQKKVAAPNDIVYREIPGGKHELAYWREVFPEFLVWAFGKGQ